MNKKTVKDIKLKGKKCLVRVDFNVPLKDGKITDDTRIRGALPTIEYLIKEGAKLILCSHLGRPKGEWKEELSLKVVADRVSKLLGQKVYFGADIVGDQTKKIVSELKNGEVVLLENLRFFADEEKNGKGFAKKLGSLADVFVNDAFGAAHRAHASTSGVVQHGFIKEAVAGFLMEKEIEMLDGAVNNPKRPLVAILGGAKVSDKINVIDRLLDKCDTIIIGGGMAYTFKKALNIYIGNSLCEDDKIDLALKLMDKAKKNNVKLLLPIDTVSADKFSNDANVQISKAIPPKWLGLDIGPKSCELFRQEIIQGKTIIWNGPMGVFEMPKFAEGTKHIANSLVEAKGATTIVGGGDSVAAVNQLKLADKMSHVSTGGGASLELLEGKVLPGIDCLNDK